MKKRIQPYFWLIGVAGIFLSIGLVYFGLHMFSSRFKPGSPIEPQGLNGEANLYDFWFSEADIYDLSVDRNVTGIFFGTDAGKVSLLDRERRLLWEKSFSSEPIQAKISPCGNYVAVGTAGGKLFYMSANQQKWWEAQGEGAVYQIAISANGKWVVVGRGDHDTGEHYLELYTQAGELQWSLKTGSLLNIFLAGEQVDQGMIFYSDEDEGKVSTAAVSLEGSLIWTEEGAVLSAVSQPANRLALFQEGALHIKSFMGQPLWDKQLPFSVEKALFNPQNQNVLLYGKGDSSGVNLYYFNVEGMKLWEKRIADGSLFSFTADGNYIVTSSWRHYKDDYSLMVLFDEGGREVERWEVAMKVEFLLVTGHRRFIVLGGEDGYIEIIDLDDRLEQSADRTSPAAPLYNPVAVTNAEEFNMVTLYFSGDDETLVPVTRPVSKTENRLRAAVEELIRGPSRDSFLFRTFPKDSQIDVLFDDEKGQLFLDLSPETAGMAGSAQSTAALDSLLLTLTGFPEVKEIYLTVEGQLLDTFGDGLALDQPLTPYRWNQPVFVPVRSGGRYYLSPLAARDMQIENRDLDGLLRAAIRSTQNFYFVPQGLELSRVEVKNNTVFITLTEEFRDLFHEDATEANLLQAALFLDAIFLTAKENSRVNRVEILVEDDRWSPPEAYPEPRRNFYGRYHINPES